MADLEALAAFNIVNTDFGRRRAWRSLFHVQLIYLLGWVILWGFTNVILATIILAVFEIGFFIRTGIHPARWCALHVVSSQLKKLHHDQIKDLVGPATLTYDDKGIHLHKGSINHDLLWEDILRIETTEDHLFLYTGEIDAIVVPKRSFHVDSEMNHFIDEIQKYRMKRG